MTWQLMWRNVKAVVLNAILQLLVIYRWINGSVSQKKKKILQYFKVQFVFIYKNFKKKFFQKVYKQVLQNGLIALYMCVCVCIPFAIPCHIKFLKFLFSFSRNNLNLFRIFF